MKKIIIIVSIVAVILIGCSKETPIVDEVNNSEESEEIKYYEEKIKNLERELERIKNENKSEVEFNILKDNYEKSLMEISVLDSIIKEIIKTPQLNEDVISSKGAIDKVLQGYDLYKHFYIDSFAHKNDYSNKFYIDENNNFIKMLENYYLIIDERAISLEVLEYSLSKIFSKQIVQEIILDNVQIVGELEEFDKQKTIISYDNRLLTQSIDGHSYLGIGKTPYYEYIKAQLISISDDNESVKYKLEIPLKCDDDINNSYTVNVNQKVYHLTLN